MPLFAQCMDSTIDMIRLLPDPSLHRTSPECTPVRRVNTVTGRSSRRRHRRVVRDYSEEECEMS